MPTLTLPLVLTRERLTEDQAEKAECILVG